MKSVVVKLSRLGLGGVGLALALSSCGGSNSIAGTSSTNCLVALQSAIARAPQGDRVLGVKEIASTQLHRLRFLRGIDANVCVVGFSVPHSGGAKNGHTLYVVVYRQSNNHYLGSAYFHRHPIRIEHFL